MKRPFLSTNTLRFKEACSRRWTVPLSALRPRHLATAGSKAVTLGQLLQAGLPVPLGFVLTACAFKAFLRSAPGWTALLPSLTQCRGVDAAQAAELSKKCQNALLSARIPETLDAEINRALEEHTHVGLWAVRSSSTAEDLPQTSFAGQYESFLNVSSGEILERVRRCWISLFTPRALAYRIHNHIPHDRLAMAVIVQQMIPADTAGVLFTLDPVSGDPYRIVLEGAAGLGDQVVSGHVRSHCVALSKWTLEIQERRPTAERLDNPITDELARRLGQLGLDVERVLRRPVDLEWAVCRGQVYLLQSRPITAFPKARTWEDRQLWTNLNTGEGFPDVTTPITWSLLQRFLDPLLRCVFHMAGAELGANPVVGLVAGRVYFNANTGLAAVKPLSFLINRLAQLGRTLGGGQVELSRRVLQSIPNEDLPDLGFRWHKYLLSIPGSLLNLLRHSPRRGDAWTLRLKARIDEISKAEIETVPTPELAAFFQRLVQEGFQDWDLLYLCVQGLALPVFEFACRKWLNDPGLTSSYRLFSGLGGVAEAEAGLALWRLAALASANQEVAAALASLANWEDTAPKLQELEAGRQFISEWNAFMAEHGHHARGELELYNPRWRETPDYILNLVRGYVRSIDRINPLENHRRLTEQRLKLTEQCLGRLRNPLKRWLFAKSLDRAQRVAVNREEWKNQAVRQMSVLRRVLLELGQRFQQQGTLAERDEIFFLEADEIQSLTTGGVIDNARTDLRKKISSRRSDYAKNLTLKPPPLVVGKFNPVTVPPLPVTDGNMKVLEGMPVSPGVVTGRAKVILHSDNHEQVMPGEILIAPSTDPAWTPYFITAAGVVTDQGGVLSHGSVVAREYGLPAVTDVGCATLRIKSGTLVQVDGNRGCVTILE